MSTHNMGFYEEMAKIIFQLISSNIIKYTFYLFFFSAEITSLLLIKADKDFYKRDRGMWTKLDKVSISQLC